MKLNSSEFSKSYELSTYKKMNYEVKNASQGNAYVPRGDSSCPLYVPSIGINQNRTEPFRHVVLSPSLCSPLSCSAFATPELPLLSALEAPPPRPS